MNTKNTLNRAYAHWLNDGIVEIGLGILFTGVGTLRAIIHFAGEKSTTYYWLLAGLLLFMIGFGWGSKRVGEALKARITYPRTGFMALKPRTYNYKNILALLIFGGILGGMLGILSTQPNQQRVGIIVPITLGIVGALAFTFAAQRVEVKRFYYLAAISIGLGLAIGTLRVRVGKRRGLFYLSIGLAMIVTGGLALAQFLRSHEPVGLNEGESL